MGKRQETDQAEFGLSFWHGGIAGYKPSRPHRHNEIEVNYVQRGSLTHVHAGRRLIIETDRIACFWAAVPHNLALHDEETRVYWATVPLAYVANSVLPRPAFSQLLAGAVFVSPTQHLPYSAATFEQWEADIAASHTQLALIEVCALIARLALNDHDSLNLTAAAAKADSAHAHAVHMARYLSEHYRRSIRVQEVADSVGLQQNYAMSLFKANFHMTIKQYLNQLRVAHAQEMLILTDHDVAHICYESGFDTISYFYKCFQQLVGVPPGKYRQSLDAGVPSP